MARRYGVKVHLLSRNIHDGMIGQAVTIYRKIMEDAIQTGIDGFSFYEAAGLYEMNKRDAVVTKALAQATIMAAARTVKDALRKT